MKKPILIAVLCLTASLVAVAQSATVRISAQTPHQRITGFGGFVCSPQFTYNHMSNTEIEKVWGKGSTVGCNIMRLYIPIGRNAWGQSLATAKKAKQMGLIVFASPWGQPAEWKTNGTSNAKNSDGTTGKLKQENWGDYAQYLEDYVQYLRKNGVELDAISIQNEPDWAATYAGCLWSASEIASFVKTYGRTISCKIMAPETLSVNDEYANQLNRSDVVDCFDIYGGHQYGGIQSAYKKLAQKGKEIWMTEYLINWNEAENNTRSFDFSKDFFNFFRAINTCMLGDFNAWVHYAAKRYYAMLGDGQRGTSNGTVTKRGYIMAHFARFVTGMTRIDIDLSNAGLEGSAYLSQTGDTVVAVIANTADKKAQLTLDLPFYTQQGELYSTNSSENFASTTLATAETCRPEAVIPGKSVSTVLFIRSRDRQPSDMKGTATRFDRLDDMATTNTNFGTTYWLSGKTGKKFDSTNPLISSNKNTSNGYIALNDRYAQLVMQIKKVTTTSALTAGATTLTYVNGQGHVATHAYGRMDLSKGENFDLVFDLSPATLKDGCIGLLSLTCDNTQSHLTINFGDVYLSKGSSAYYSTLSGEYVADDTNVLDYTSDDNCVSIDMTTVTGLPSSLPWLEGKNRVVYVGEGSSLSAVPNVVAAGRCSTLSLHDDGGDFRPAKPFFAETITQTMTIEGMRFIMLPFNAVIPAGAHAYILNEDLTLMEMRSIPAHTPILVYANGTITFTGSGDVSYAVSPPTDQLRGTYTTAALHAGDYVLRREGDGWGLRRLTANATLAPFEAYAQLTSTNPFIALDLSALPKAQPGDVNGDGTVDVGDIMVIINYMSTHPSSTEAPEIPEDLNGDGTVDVGDIMVIINIMAQ